MANTSGERTPLGKPATPVRVLNFAGNGFDSIMQLGVAHALLVIQGRAPDAIVGVSAGAIQAVAVAEILQAGDKIVVDRQKDIAQQRDSYQRCRAARVERFRDMVNAAQRAPEELIDASLPDTYQIDSRDPLQPLRTARFVKKERDEREGHLRMRSGLVALYNHLLRINLPVGSITRIVRRWLGLKAAAESPNVLNRLLVGALELLRVWLLFGAELHRLVTAAPLLLRPLLLTQTHARAATAGSLIFRFRAVRFLWLTLLYSVALFVLASTWVTVTTLPAIIAVLFFVEEGASALSYWLIVVALPYLIPLLITLAQVARKHDAVTRFGALADGLRGLLQFAISLFVWGGLPFFLIAYQFELLDKVFKEVNRAHIFTAQLVVAGTAIFVLIVVWILVLFWYDRARQRVDGESKISFKRWYGQRFLQSYSLSRSLLHPYGLEKFLSDLFDRQYYGPIDDGGQKWERSLEEPVLTAAVPSEPGKCLDFDCARKIRYYSRERNPPIVLGLAVADMGTGKVDVMDDDAPLICGLRAATALAPIFPALRYNGRVLVDSTNVTAVPMPALLSLLRRNGVNVDATVVHVYRIAPVPFSRPPKEQKPRTFLNLIDIAFRAIKLRQYRDADLERRLTERYTKLMPAGKAVVSDEELKRDFFRIWVAPVELELPVGLNTRIMFAERTERRVEILRTIAQGCRAALQVMVSDAVKRTCNDEQGGTVRCAKAVRHHLKYCIDGSAAEKFGELPLPGSQGAAEPVAGGDWVAPPGLSEICRHCELMENPAAASSGPRQQVLLRREWKDTPTSWPHEFETDKTDRDDRHFIAAEEPVPDARTIEALGRYWPRERRGEGANGSPVNRPMVSLLFSGGVFRGVFQVGAVNALKILKVRPDIVAGASVGSITAAMAAQLLTEEDNSEQHLARLAAVYLSVDRIILTDRFADFVREFTIRAAGTRFSLRQADRLFRTYDQPWLFNFDKSARQVIAGIERLFYISPYQINQLVRAMRHREGRRAVRLGRKLGQQWLDRMNVGEEVLGADALKELIAYFIPSTSYVEPFSDRLEDTKRLRGVFTSFLSKGVLFLATTANLSGELLTLGDPFHDLEGTGRVDLTNALLASSAFPGVFRPRWAPEVLPDTHESHQFIDGGVMDNLPIDAVLNVLLNASQADAKKGLLIRRPTGAQSSTNGPVPHLAFAVSLEPEFKNMTRDDALSALETFWPALMSRAKQLGYNGKLDNYCEAALEVSRLHERFAPSLNGVPQQLALNLEIAALKPKWLCGTFAFHPMLGYRRAKQAESIAHGCALTLLRFAKYEKSWLSGWGIDYSELPEASSLEEARERWTKPKRDPKVKNGKCWLRPEKLCPFSVEFLKEQNSRFACDQRLADRTIKEISRIHKCCEEKKTHEAH